MLRCLAGEFPSPGPSRVQCHSLSLISVSARLRLARFDWAYTHEAAFIAEMQERINFYYALGPGPYNLNRWVAVRLELFGALFTTALAGRLDSISRIKKLPTCVSGMILVCVRCVSWLMRELNLVDTSPLSCFNDFGVQSNSLERALRFEQEPASTAENIRPAYCLSSLPPLALLRAISTEDTVLYDGVPTVSINLDEFEYPELLAGTLRHELDVFNAHEDAG
ncbi:hypothetical protein C8R46DRAFT_1188483 [Mycena filopes]|nr:hypothetical protein C8R46DRAFT_1188483 [Mycena filopes]